MRLAWQRRRLHLRHPFHIARNRSHAGTDKEVLLVRLEHAGQVGWGEAAPVSYYHQSLDSNQAALVQAAELLGDDPLALEAIHERLWARLADQPAAIAAIDGALHDLVGKLLGVPVWRLLGLDAARVPFTSFTIGLDAPEVMAAKVRKAEEFPILKVKVGTPEDQAILSAIRREAPGKPLRVDANCGWSAGEVLEHCRMVSRFGVELIEQPVPRSEAAALAAVKAQGLGPLIADESCTSAADVLGCAGLFDGVNIKLCKCGGIRPALKMIHVARAAGLKVMLGCMVETSVGIAAAAQLAPLADYLDLDGHLLLADDPFEGIGGAGGRITLSGEPGLGVRERG